jgi:hypothetical protein
MLISTAQASSFRLIFYILYMMFQVISVFCSESVDCFPGVASKIFLTRFVTVPVAPVLTGIILHFRLHIHYISLHKLLYFSFLSVSFCM